MSTWGTRVGFVTVLTLAVTGCTISSGGAQSSAPAPSTPSAPTASTEKKVSTVQITPEQAERLKAAMVPLLRAMNHPLQPGQVKVGVMNDPHINAASAGSGEFFVTTGLLQKANDEELRGVLAHELAHQDLGHVAKSQAVGTGLNIGMILLDQIIPGARVLAPIAGNLVLNAYTRKEEYAADAHGVDILNRAGLPGKQTMVDTLTWLQQTEGGSGGGFFATHPATGDRIAAVQHLH
jgi:Zn-dependent protease with chaperone function